MSRVVKVDKGDYIIQTQNGGDIYMDVGTTGTLTVSGNLTVIGTSSQISTQNLTVTDNIILVNQGETGNGVSLGVAGIEVDRGTADHSQFLWSESVSHYDPIAAQNVSGSFVARIKNGNATAIQVSTVVSGLSNLIFDLQNTPYVLSIANSVNYEQRVLSSNDIPNRKFVTDYVSASGGTANVTNIHYPLTGTQNSSVTCSNTTIDFVVGTDLKTRVSAAGLAVNNVLLAGNVVTNTSGNNLKLTATNNGVEVGAVLSLDNIETLSGSYDVSVVSGSTKIYASATAGPGKTGVYFANSTTTDELISKNRAVLYSILF